jgi:hypothetical protein
MNQRFKNVIFLEETILRLMEGIHFLTDDQNNRIAVQIDLRKHGALWEDFYDTLLAEQRKDDEKIPLEQLITDLKKSGKLT